MANPLKIRADFSMDTSSVEKSIKAIQDSLSNLGIGKGITEQFNKAFNEIRKNASNFSQLSSKEEFSRTDISNMEKYFSSIITGFSRVKDLLAGVQRDAQLNPSKFFPEEIKKRIRDAQAAMDAFEKTISKPTEEIKKQQSSYEALQGEIAQLDEKQEDLNALLEEQKRIQAEIAKINSENKPQTDQLEVLEKYLEALKEVQDIQTQISQKKKQASALGSIGDLEATIETNQETIRKHTKGRQKRIDEGKTDTKWYDDRIQAAQKRIAKAEEDLRRLQKLEEEINTLTSRRKSYGQVFSIDGKIAKKPDDTELPIGKDEKKIAERIETTAAEIDAMRGRIAQSTEQLQGQLAIVEQAIQETSADLPDQAILEEKKRAFEDLGRSLEQLKAEVSQSAFEKLTESLKKLGIEIDPTVDDIDEIQKTVDGLQAEQVQTVTTKFEAASGATEEFDKKLKKGEEELDDFGNTAKNAFSFDNEIGEITSRLVRFFSLSSAVNLFTKNIKQAYQEVKNLDAVMTETAVVTDFSVGDMWDKLPQYTEQAKALGATTQGLYEITTLYYQQGLKTNEVFEIGTETAKMARIAGMDYADATDKMTAALRGFNMELNETSAQRINDVYSKLAAITAADTDEIATAMTKTASIADSAGMAFETTAAFLTQVIETTREAPETAGTAMKTVIARFTEMKKAASDVIDVDGETIDVNKVDTALKSVGVSLKDAKGQFRDLDDVFLELSAKWNSLDKMSQRYVATMAAGSRQQSRFIAMMQNYSRTVELVDAANDSSGASNEQFEKTLDSLEAKINTLKDVWQEFLLGLTNSSVIKFGVEVLTKLVEVLNKATTSSTSLLTSLLKWGTIITAFSTVRNFLQGYLDGIIKLFTEKFGQAGQEAGKALRKNLEKNSKVDDVADKTAKTVKEELSGTTATGYAQKAISDAYNGIKSSGAQSVKLSTLLGAEISVDPRSNQSIAIGAIRGNSEEYKQVQGTIEQLAEQAIRSAASERGGFTQEGEVWAQELLAGFKAKIASGSYVDQAFENLEWNMKNRSRGKYNNDTGSWEGIYVDGIPGINPETNPKTGSEDGSKINENTEKMKKAAKSAVAVSTAFSTLGLALNAVTQNTKDSMGIWAGLSTALTTAGSAMMTLNTVTQLFKVTMSTGAMAGIALAIGAIAGIVSAVKKHKEALEEARQATIEDAKASKEEADSLRENYKEYNNLLQTYKKNGEGKEELADKTKELIEQYKDEIDGLENLGDNYEAVAKKIKKYLKEKNTESRLEAGAAAAAADESIENDSKVMGTYAGSGYSDNGMWAIEARTSKIKDQDLEAIQKELSAYITDQGYSIKLSDVEDYGYFNIEGIDTAADKVAAYNTALKLRNELEKKGYTETAYYAELVEWIGNAKAGIESLDEALQEKIIAGVQSVTLDFEGLDQIDDFKEYSEIYGDIYDKVKALNDEEEWGLSDEQIRKQVRAQLEGYENLADFVQQQDFEIEIKTKFGENNSDVDDWLNELREDGDLSLLVGVDIEDVETFEELQSIINQKKIDIKLNIGTSISNAAANVIDAIMAQTKDKKLSKEQTEELQEFNAALSKTPGLFDESKTAYEEFYDRASEGTIKQLSYLGKWVSEAAKFQDEYDNAYLAAGMSSQFTVKTQEAQDQYNQITGRWQNVIDTKGISGAMNAGAWEPDMQIDDMQPFVNAAEDRLEYFDYIYKLSADRRKEVLKSYETALADYEGLTKTTFDAVASYFNKSTGLLNGLTSEDAIYVLTDQIKENLGNNDVISLGVKFEYNDDKTVEENYEKLIKSIEARKVEIKETEPPLDERVQKNMLGALDELEKEELKIKAEIEIKGIESTQKQLEVLDGHLDSIKSLMDKIGEGFEIDYSSLDEVMNLAPELLRNATVTSEGIIKLNEKTVKNFIDGQLEEEKAHHKTIIDQKKEELKKAQENTKQIRAEIDRVEAQKTAEVEISSERAAEMLSIETFLQQERLSEDEKTEQGVAEASQKAAQAQIDNSKAVATALDAVNEDLSIVAQNYQNLAEGNYEEVKASALATTDAYKGTTTGSEAVTSNGEKKTLSEIYAETEGTTTLKVNTDEYLRILEEMEKKSLEDEGNIQASIDDWDNYLKLEEAALAGMKKTLGKSKDKSSSEKDPFENDRSEADNLQNQIEKEQKIRNQLEEEYNDLQDEENKNYDAILENLQKQNESLEREKELAQQIKDIRDEDVQDYLNRHPELSKYATYEDGVLTYNIEALDALNGDTTGKGEEIDKKLDELEKLIKEKDTAEEKYDEIIKKEKDIVDKEEEVRKEIKEKAEEEAKKAADRTVQLMDFIGDTINTAFEFLKLSLDKLYNINSALKAIERRANRLGTEYEKMLRDRPGDGDEIDVNTRIENATMRVSSAMEKYLTANEKKNQAENELARYNLQSAFSPGSLSYDFGAGRIRKDPVKALMGDVFGVSLNWLSTFTNFSGEIAKYTDEKTNTNMGEVASTVATGIASLATSAYDSFKDYGSDIDQQIESLSQELDNAYDEMLEALDELYELQSIGLEQYLDLEQEVYDALQDSIQQEIDELEKFNDNITEADQDLTDSLRDMVDSIRQTRENEKTEKDLADKERRLAYLRQDTSGANLQEILKLEKELEESQQSYTDSLIDQKIDELEKQNELAAEQRQLQIEILQAQKEDAAVQWATVTEILNRMVTQNADGTFTEHPEEVLSMLRNTDTYKNASPVKQQEMDKGFYQLINGGMDYVAFQKNGGISSILTEVSLDYSQDLLDSINTLLGSGYKITKNGITSVVAGFTDILDLAGLKDVAEKAAEAANKAGQSELAKKFESLIARINASGKALDEKLTGEQLSAIISDFIDLDTGLPKGFKNSSMKVNDEQYAGIINAQTIQTGILSDFKKAAEDFFSVAVVGLGAGGSIATAFGGLALALPGIISAALPFLSALTKGDLAGMIGSFMGIDTSGAGAGGLAALGGGSLLGIIAGLIGLFTDFAGKDYQGASNGLMSILENVMNFVTGIGKILGGGSSGGSSGGTGDVFLKLLSGFADFIRSASPVLGDLLNSIGLLIALPGIFKSMESGGVATGGLTLVGENGVELIQGNGYAYLAGTNGPEFTNLNKGDYVYNNKDTRRVLRNGRLMPRYENGAIPFSNPLKAYAYKIPNYSNGVNNNSQSSRELTSNVHLNMDGVLIDSPERVDEIANRVFEKIRDWTWPDNGWLNR